ncbi:phosphate/phosphite/phosphonate ABC transporter substrate-binding protein [Luteimonas sp. SJ-92]|uniref:Phosphate/phosphite/phosphonate ABC transporter substrate-binding protein n=1 Tax=Luteimonas salinisoli TaxID=2752307 RepID=A0A853JIP2_9GAMM|nr:phosphate/phosphite/phosphonate ABC transporter substrate-binding protein [Luteimonas salinisoli]NZA28604.1 phosphate/phosphite/phosphonate ABC transporter substrate-binding protein [Luteimonas salinisoli]
MPLQSPIHALPRAARTLASLLVLLCGSCFVPARAADTDAAPPLRFGILPTGGPAESRQDWQPLLDDLAKALERPVEGVSVSTYEGMYRAVADRRVDVAFLSGKLALDAVLKNDMQVAVQLERTDGSPGYRAVLVSRRGGPVRTPHDVFANPGRWTYARGETLSVSGYLVPEAQLFARRGVNSDLHFKAVHIDNHQNNALAVANGEVDVASNNSADLERFAVRFPRQFAELHVLWRSDPIPHATLVVARELPDEVKADIRRFLLDYGRGAQAGSQRRNLLKIHELSGFVAADDRALLPFAEIEYALARQQAESARWVDAAAKRARIERLRARHERTKGQLARSAADGERP